MSPKQLRPRPIVDRTSGRLDDHRARRPLRPLLGLPGRRRGPLLGHAPTSSTAASPSPTSTPRRSAPQLETYLRDLLAVSRANGWDRRSYFYAYDEPGRGAELDAEALARIAHAVSGRARLPRPLPADRLAAAGGRRRPRRQRLPVRRRRHLVPERLPLLRRRCRRSTQRRAEGADVWWYTYASREADSAIRPSSSTSR